MCEGGGGGGRGWGSPGGAFEPKKSLVVCAFLPAAVNRGSVTKMLMHALPLLFALPCKGTAAALDTALDIADARQHLRATELEQAKVCPKQTKRVLCGPRCTVPAWLAFRYYRVFTWPACACAFAVRAAVAGLLSDLARHGELRAVISRGDLCRVQGGR